MVVATPMHIIPSMIHRDVEFDNMDIVSFLLGTANATRKVAKKHDSSGSDVEEYITYVEECKPDGCRMTGRVCRSKAQLV